MLTVLSATTVKAGTEVNSKTRTPKHNRPAMSPLLRALAFSRTTHEPVTQAMLLQCYTALDAFDRGHGSRALFTTLGRHLLVSVELCHLGFEPDALGEIESAHAAMVQLDATGHEDGWLLDDDAYVRLCVALAILDRQLQAASLEAIARAEARMIEGLMRVDRKAIADATV